MDWPAVMAIRVGVCVEAGADGEQALLEGDAGSSGHDGFLVVRSVRLLFREAAGYLNTATRRPTAFPLRVLYGCALPGHDHKLQAQKNRELSGTVSPLVEVCSAPVANVAVSVGGVNENGIDENGGKRGQSAFHDGHRIEGTRSVGQ